MLDNFTDSAGGNPLVKTAEEAEKESLEPAWFSSESSSFIRFNAAIFSHLDFVRLEIEFRRRLETII